MTRSDGREPGEMRPVTIQRRYLKTADGSALISFGDTVVLCTATIEDRVPPFLRDSGKGWVTAEYAMLPGSASEGRISRDAVRRGRAQEISRLIGRSLRSVTDLARLRDCQIVIDCDVLQADGGTRTAAITGGYVALSDAINRLIEREFLTESPLVAQCAAVSLGLSDGKIWVDLNYEEDSKADVDLNLVVRSDGGIIEIQATAEREPFDKPALDAMIDSGHAAIEQLFKYQRDTLARG